MTSCCPDGNDLKIAQLSIGNYSCLVAEFHLHRSIGFHLIQSYLPSILIVAISWVSFWMDVDCVPARYSEAFRPRSIRPWLTMQLGSTQGHSRGHHVADGLVSSHRYVAQGFARVLIKQLYDDAFDVT